MVGAANLIYFKSLLMFSLPLSHHYASMIFFFQNSQIFLKLKVPEVTRNYNPAEMGGMA